MTFKRPETAGISRRSLLKGIGIGAVSVGAASIFGLYPETAAAQAAPSPDSVTGLARFNLGDFRITVLSDGGVTFPPATFAANVPEAEANAWFEANHLPPSLSVNVLLVEHGERKILLDTGSGDFVMSGDYTGATGKLRSTLDFLGVQPEAINDVILTHFHPDHIAGVSLDGEAVFSNAQYYFPQIDLDFITSDVQIEALLPFIQMATSKLQPLMDNDQLVVFKDEDEIVPGIQAVPAHGHTLGHVALKLESNGQQLLNVVDLAIHAGASLEHPEWHMAFDMLPDEAVESRRRLLGQAADEGSLVMGYHFPFPGVGYIVRAGEDGEGFRFLANLP